MADIATLGIRVTTQGVREAATDLDKLDKSADKTTKSAAELGKAWGLALGGAIVAGTGLAVAGLKKYVSNTMEAERIQAQLASTIKSTGGAAGLAIGDLNRMADALMRATTFDDESINQTQGLLLTFTRIGKDVFPRATEAVLDMSTALGTDLKSAALQVGKALNDPVAGLTALSRAGVQFTEAQEESIKKLVETGEVAQAQTLILQELETQMGGSARAARDTLGGALQALSNTFDNLLEGDSGAGGVRGTRQAIEELTRTLNDPGVKRGIDELANGLLTIANNAVELIAKLGSAGAAVAEFFGEAENRSTTMLQNQRNELESQMFALERRIKARSKFSTPFDILSGYNSIDARALSDVKKQITEIDEIMDRRNRADFSGVTATVLRASGGKAPGGAADPDAPARIRSRTTATKELTQAERDFQEVMETGNMIAEMQEQYHRDAVAAEYDRLKAIDAGREATQQLIEDMRFELALVGMTNRERMKATALRYADVNATKEQLAEIDRLADAQYEAERSASFWYDTQRALSDSIMDAVEGTKSLNDALEDFLGAVSRRLLQQFADDWAEKITNTISNSMSNSSANTASSTSGEGGGWAAFAAQIASAWFGGGRASGGPVSAGRLYEVGERGPELLQSHGRNYLIPGRDGTVQPGVPALAGAGITQNITNTFSERVDRRSRSAVESSMYRATTRAQGRR